MKKLYTSIGLFLTALLSAQVPQAFSYQTIAFNASGAPISNGNVSLRVSILENSATGTALYTEIHTKTTNTKGLVNLNIGQGTTTTGSFGGINWGNNTKFVKVEMDPQGGSNYTNVGVNQLMSVPYAQVSKTVVTGAGQGITLTSPNGTAYTLNVNDGGILNLPQSQPGVSNDLPQNLYVYGSYNSFNAANAELLRIGGNEKFGYKYFPANTQIKFLTAQNSSAAVYGSDSNNIIIPNGNAYQITSNGFYQINIRPTGFVGNTTAYIPNMYNFTPYIYFSGAFPSSQSNMTYDVNTNTFSIQINGITSSTKFKINLGMGGPNTETIGDNLSDGNFDINGEDISFPGANSVPKNYRLSFKINFDATGTYTIVQI